jgi:hypothetical protein
MHQQHVKYHASNCISHSVTHTSLLTVACSFAGVDHNCFARKSASPTAAQSLLRFVAQHSSSIVVLSAAAVAAAIAWRLQSQHLLSLTIQKGPTGHSKAQLPHPTTTHPAQLWESRTMMLMHLLHRVLSAWSRSMLR